MLEISTIKKLTHPSHSGLTLLETQIALVLLGVLISLLLSFGSRLMARTRLNIATAELASHWKAARYQAMGEGNAPLSLCMAELETEKIKHARIRGDNCESVTEWAYLTRGVSIDVHNSTLRRVQGIGGNNGTIFRASWADTRGGIGGSWGQLGRITLIAAGTHEKRCLFLFNVDGSWNIRQGSVCDRPPLDPE